MHYEETVITLCDNNKKPFREHSSERLDKGRKCKVYVPFETEYQFLIKNNTDRRIRLEIDIDGTDISQGGFIVNSLTTTHLERFLNEAKKFKFVPLSNEGVSDPTSRENGVIKVRVAKEKKAVLPIVIREDHHHFYDYWQRSLLPPRTPWWGNGLLRGGGNTTGGFVPSLGSDDMCYGSTSASYSLNATSSSLPADSSIQNGQTPNSIMQFTQTSYQPGATVEGSKSDQTFVSTSWAGDDEISFFTFEMLGVKEIVDPEYLEYLRLQEKFGKK